jgi:hypothetical protein
LFAHGKWVASMQLLLDNACAKLFKKKKKKERKKVEDLLEL